MTKINVNLGATICTDPDSRNFLRIGVDALDIDTEGDVEAQAQAALKASVQVIKVLDDGLKEVVTDVVLDDSTPGTVKQTLDSHEDKINRMARVFHKAVQRIDALEGKNDGHDE